MSAMPRRVSGVAGAAKKGIPRRFRRGTNALSITGIGDKMSEARCLSHPQTVFAVSRYPSSARSRASGNPVCGGDPHGLGVPRLREDERFKGSAPPGKCRATNEPGSRQTFGGLSRQGPRRRREWSRNCRSSRHRDPRPGTRRTGKAAGDLLLRLAAPVSQALEEDLLRHRDRHDGDRRKPPPRLVEHRPGDVDDRAPALGKVCGDGRGDAIAEAVGPPVKAKAPRSTASAKAASEMVS